MRTHPLVADLVKTFKAEGRIVIVAPPWPGCAPLKPCGTRGLADLDSDR